MFGEIAPKMLGKISNGEFTFPSLSLTGNTPSYSAPANILSAVGNVQFSGGYVKSALNTLDDGTSAITLSNSGSTTSQIGKGTYTGLLQLGGNSIDVTANSTGSVSIGNALNTVYLGSQGSANSVVNVQPGTGSNSTNICATAGYSGTLTIGNSSITGINLLGTTNINTSGSSAVNIGNSGYTGTVSIGNNFCTVTMLGTVNISTSGANTISIANSGSTTNVIGNINLGTSGGSQINIGTSSYTGTLSIGNGSIAAINILGVTNINTSGSSPVNIGTGSYTGTVAIGNTSSQTNINSALNFTTNPSPSLTGGVTVLYNQSGIGFTIASPQFEVFTNTAGTATLGFRVDTSQVVTTKNNTLDDGTGRVTVNYSSANAGIILNQSTSGDRSDIRINNTADSTLAIIGLDGAGGLNADPGSLLISTGSSKSIYLSPGGVSAWAAKAVVVSSQGYLINGKGFPWGITTVTTPATGSQTITAAQILGGIILSPVQSAAYTWTTDTGTNLYTAMGSPAVGTTVQCLWSNDNNAAGAVMTISFGSGISGSLRGNTLNNNQSMVIYFRCTGTNTFTAYS